MKYKQKLRNNHRLEETQKMKQIKVIWYLGLDPGIEKEY